MTCVKVLHEHAIVARPHLQLVQPALSHLPWQNPFGGAQHTFTENGFPLLSESAGVKNTQPSGFTVTALCCPLCSVTPPVTLTALAGLLPQVRS